MTDVLNQVSTNGQVVRAQIGIVGLTGRDAKGQLFELSSDARRIDFGDKTIEVIELAKDEWLPADKVETRQPQVHRAAVSVFRGDMSLPQPSDRPRNALALFGFNDGLVGVTLKLNNGGYIQRSYLADDFELMDVYAGGVVDARSKDQQLGVAWVCYLDTVQPGKANNCWDVPVVGQGPTAAINALNGSFTLFPGASASATLDWRSSSGSCAPGFGVAGAALVVTGLFVGGPVGPVLQACGAVVSVLGLLCDQFSTPVDDASEIVLWGVFDLADGRTRPSVANSMLRCSLTGPNAMAPWGASVGGLWAPTVDQTYRLFITSSTLVRATSRSALGWVGALAELDVQIPVNAYGMSVSWGHQRPEDDGWFRDQAVYGTR